MSTQLTDELLFIFDKAHKEEMSDEDLCDAIEDHYAVFVYKNLDKFKINSKHHTLNSTNKIEYHKSQKNMNSLLECYVDMLLGCGLLPTINGIKITPEQIEQRYPDDADLMKRRIYHSFIRRNVECRNCGENCQLYYKDFTFYITRRGKSNGFSYTSGNTSYIKLPKRIKYNQHCIKPKVAKFKVNFPTGRLLINDWFRPIHDLFDEKIGGVSTLVETHEKGMYYLTHNLIHSHNTSYATFIERANGFHFNSYQLDEADNIIGGGLPIDVGGGYRALCIIDEYHYINLLKKVGLSDDEINDVCKLFDGTRFNVTPGNYIMETCKFQSYITLDKIGKLINFTKVD